MVALALFVLVRQMSSRGVDPYSRLVGASGHSYFDEMTAEPAVDPDDGSQQLRTLDQAVRFATSAAGDFHSRVRPILGDLARSRLAARGIMLDDIRQHEHAEAMLGPEVFELVRPDRSPPVDRFGRGVPIEAMERAVSALEAMK